MCMEDRMCQTLKLDEGSMTHILVLKIHSSLVIQHLPFVTKKHPYWGAGFHCLILGYKRGAKSGWSAKLLICTKKVQFRCFTLRQDKCRSFLVHSIFIFNRLGVWVHARVCACSHIISKLHKIGIL